MRLIAKTRLSHRPTSDEETTLSEFVEIGEEFEIDEKAGKILVAQGEAEPAKAKKPAEPKA